MRVDGHVLATVNIRVRAFPVATVQGRRPDGVRMTGWEAALPGQLIGSLIGGAFGFIYVEVNAGALPGAAAWAVRVLGVVALAALLLAARRRSVDAAARGTDTEGDVVPGAGTRHDTGPSGARGPAFGRGYWIVVVVEFLAIFAGVRLLAGPLDRPEAGVAWVSLVVGVHFFALAVHFARRFFHVLGAAIALSGVVGLVIDFAGGSAAVVAVVAGIIPGAILMAFAGWGLHTRAPSLLTEQSRDRT